MTIYICTLFTAVFLGLVMRPNSGRKRKKSYIIIVFGLIVLISALRKYTVGKDLEAHYFNTFLRLQNLSWTEAFTATSYEKGFIIFLKLVSRLFSNPQWLIALNSIFTIGIVGWFIYKNSEDVVLSTFLFIACNTWFMELNIIRQGMAISTGLLAAEIYKRRNLGLKRYILFAAVLLLATSFHSSAIILILIPLADRLQYKRSHVVWSVLILSAAFLLYDHLFRLTSSVISITRNYAEYYENKVYGSGSITGFAVYEFLIPFICFFLANWTIFLRRSMSERAETEQLYIAESRYKDNFLMYMVLFLVLCRLLRFRIYIVTRMAYFFIPYMWLLFPRALRFMRGLRNRALTNIILYCLLTVIFIYVGYTNAASYYGTIPYLFFWE